jgi:hypothetical protein
MVRAALCTVSDTCAQWTLCFMSSLHFMVAPFAAASGAPVE